MRTRTESTLNVIWSLLVRIVLTAALVWVVWKVRSVLITVILSAMLAYVLMPAVDLLSSRKFLSINKRTRRLVASIIVFILFFVIVGASITLFITPFRNEMDTFTSQLEVYSEQAGTKFNQISDWYDKHIPEDMRRFLGNQDFKGIGSGLAASTKRVVQSTAEWLKNIFELILIPVLAFYFVLDSRSLKREFIGLVPPWRIREFMKILRDTGLILQSYVVGQLILCIIAGIATAIVLNLVGMKYVLVLAVFAGVTRAIPVIGPVASGIPICILGALQSIELGVSLLIFVIIMHLVESKFIMPILIGDRMKLHPALILIALLIGAEFFGVLGMFLAAPVAAIIRELVYLYIVKPRRQRHLAQLAAGDAMTSNTIRSESV
ncbi:MAG: AI-2E family transporter [Armatimonadota bacterium]